LIQGGAAQPLFTNRWRVARSSPRAIWRSKAFISTPPSRCGVSPSVAVLSRSGSGWSPGADTVYVAWRLEAEADEPGAHLSVSLLASSRDHHGYTWLQSTDPR
jgi:hypothetical protein